MAPFYVVMIGETHSKWPGRPENKDKKLQDNFFRNYHDAVEHARTLGGTTYIALVFQKLLTTDYKVEVAE